MQGHQAPGFLSHRQSPWCAALSWRNSYGRQVLDWSRFRQPAFPTADYKTIFFLFNRKTTIQERWTVLKKSSKCFSFSQEYHCRKGKGWYKVVKRGSLLLYHTNISSYHPLQIMIWTNLEKKIIPQAKDWRTARGINLDSVKFSSSMA